MRKFNQMNYRQILDSQVQSKVNSPLTISLEPHLDNRYFVNNDNTNSKLF